MIGVQPYAKWWAVALCTQALYASITGTPRGISLAQREGRLVRVIGGGPPGKTAVGRATSLASVLDRLYVLDGTDCRVKIFTRSGDHISTFGGCGDELGALTRPIALEAVGNELRVTDASKGTVVYSLMGRYLYTVPGGRAVERMTPLRYGYELGAYAPRPYLLSGSLRGNQPWLRHVVLHPPSGRDDTLAAIPLDVVGWRTSSGTTTVRPSGFGDGGTFAVSGDSLIAIADGFSGIVRWYELSASGVRQLRTAKLPEAARPITREDVARQEARLQMPDGVMGWSGSAQSPGTRTTVRGGATPGSFIRPPGKWSVATRALFSSDGELWVGAPRTVTAYGQRNGAVVTLSQSVENNLWTVFAMTGASYNVMLPASVRLLAVHGNDIYVSSVDGRVKGLQVYTTTRSTLSAGNRR